MKGRAPKTRAGDRCGRRPRRADGRPAGQRQVDAGAARPSAAAAAGATRRWSPPRCSASRRRARRRAGASGPGAHRTTVPRRRRSSVAVHRRGRARSRWRITGSCSWMNCRNFQACPGGFARTLGDRSRDDLACRAAIRLPCALPAHRCHEPCPCGPGRPATRLPLQARRGGALPEPPERPAARPHRPAGGSAGRAAGRAGQARPMANQARRSPRAHAMARERITRQGMLNHALAGEALQRRPRSTRAVHPSGGAAQRPGLVGAWLPPRCASRANIADLAAAPSASPRAIQYRRVLVSALSARRRPPPWSLSKGRASALVGFVKLSPNGICISPAAPGSAAACCLRPTRSPTWAKRPARWCAAIRRHAHLDHVPVVLLLRFSISLPPRRRRRQPSTVIALRPLPAADTGCRPPRRGTPPATAPTPLASPRA